MIFVPPDEPPVSTSTELTSPTIAAVRPPRIASRTTNAIRQPLPALRFRTPMLGVPAEARAAAAWERTPLSWAASAVRWGSGVAV